MRPCAVVCVTVFDRVRSSLRPCATLCGKNQFCATVCGRITGDHVRACSTVYGSF